MALTLLPLSAVAARPSGIESLGRTVLASGYQIGEQGAASPNEDGGGTPTANDTTAGQGPVRLARFSYVQGNVTWRPTSGADWSSASVNLPLRQGAQIWVTNGGRAEVQFDDGSLLRLGNGAIVTLQTLYSDADGEFTEIQMNQGLAAMRLRQAKSIYQIDAPFVSVKSVGPSKVRIGVNDSVEIAVRDGSAVAEGGGGKQVLKSGDYLELADAEASYQVSTLPDPDTWDRWNDDRDRALDNADQGRLPANIALVAGDLDDYGTWHTDPRYGAIWCPSIVDAGWRPYEHGHWVWVEPFGWTWVSSEAWGWAPYHYGTWVDEPYGWAWVPGPARQYWCPAVVHFSEYNGDIAWAPLAPAEVRYPSVLGIGYRHGDWSLSFAIGGCAVYYPSDDRYCSPRPWRNVEVNRVTYVNNVTNIYENTTISSRRTINRFVPFNARNADGVTSASLAEFGGRGAYRAQPRTTEFFTQGRSYGAPQGAAPFAGPSNVRPTSTSFTPARTFVTARPNTEILQRPIFRTALPARVARVAPALPHPQSMTFQRGQPRTNRGQDGGFGNTRPGPDQTAAPGERSRRAADDARTSLGQPPLSTDRGGRRSVIGLPRETPRVERETPPAQSSPGFPRVGRASQENFPRTDRHSETGTAPARAPQEFPRATQGTVGERSQVHAYGYSEGPTPGARPRSERSDQPTRSGGQSDSHVRGGRADNNSPGDNRRSDGGRQNR